jgi:hypothetical protein
MTWQKSAFLTPGYRAVYAALKADAVLAGMMEGSNWYLYDCGDKHPIQLTAGDCPAIICSPATGRMTMTQATNVSFDVRLPLDFDLRVKDEDVDAAFALFEAVVRPLWARFILDRYGLAASIGLYKVEPGGAAVADLYDTDSEKRLVRVSWKVTFPWTLLFRRNLAAT